MHIAFAVCLGDDTYVDYIERENANKYSTRIKKYIDGLADRICLFPELVEAYNDHKFFRDSTSAKVSKIHVESEDDYMFYKYVFLTRQEFIRKEGIEDICRYAGWPMESLF